MAYSEELSCLVVASDHMLTVFALRFGLPRLYDFGEEGEGPGQFRHPRGVCFPPWGSRTLLVAEYGNDRVQEVDTVTMTCVRFWCTGALEHPVGIAASADLLVVSEWARKNRVSAFGREDGALRWRVRDTAFKIPYGLRITWDGLYVAVTDNGHDRLCFVRVHDGTFVRDVGGVKGPRDVQQVAEDVFLVACDAPHALVLLRQGHPRLVVGGDGNGIGQFGQVNGLALPRPGLVVVRERSNGGRIQALALDNL